MIDKIIRYSVSAILSVLSMLGFALNKSVLFRKAVMFCHIKRRDLIVSVWPWKVKVNTGYRCNLQCPLCPTGAGHSPNKGDMTPKMFSFILSSLQPIKEIYLFGWGEPLLNKDIFEIVSLAKNAGKYVAMSSSLNIADEEKLYKLVKSKLDFLSVSLDGVDQDTFVKYRVGGDFGLVLGNIRKIQRIKLELGAQRPHIQWQYCVNRFNQKGMDIARKMAGDIGVEIKFMPIGLYLDCLNKPDCGAADKWLPFEKPEILKGQNSADSPINSSGYCYLLYYFPFIDVDGTVFFCCPAAAAGPVNSVVDRGSITSAGNLMHSAFMEIFNNDTYAHARSLFAAETVRIDKKMVCDFCRMYRKV